MKYIVTRVLIGGERRINADMEYIDGLTKGLGDEVKVHYCTSAAEAFRFDRKSTAARVVQAMAEPGYMVGMVAVDAD